MELVLVRHGQTKWNVEEIFRGRADIELNDHGRRQAELLGEFLAVPTIEAVYSSPLKRALDTADSVARRHRLDVQVAPGLIDMDFGDWEGLQGEVVKQRYAAAYAAWTDRPEQADIPGGETLSQVRRRVMQAVDQIVAAHSGRVVIVTHRVILKLATLSLLGLDESSFWNIVVDTCGVTTFRVEGGRNILLRHNDNSFLNLPGAKLADF